MRKYTVVCDHSATGEGRTISLWIGFAENEHEARNRFASAVNNGRYYAQGAAVVDGFSFKNCLVKLFLTKSMKAQLEDDACYRSFSGQLHFNYS